MEESEFSVSTTGNSSPSRERGEGRLRYGLRASENDFEKSVKEFRDSHKINKFGLKVKRGHKCSRATIKVKVLDQPGDAAQQWGHIYYQFQINAANKQRNKQKYVFWRVVVMDIKVFAACN